MVIKKTTNPPAPSTRGGGTALFINEEERGQLPLRCHGAKHHQNQCILSIILTITPLEPA